MNQEEELYDVELTKLELKLVVQALATAPITGNVSTMKATIIAIEFLAQKFIEQLKKEVEEEDENED